MAKFVEVLLSFIDERMSAVELSKLYQNIDSTYHIFIEYLNSSPDPKSNKSMAMKSMAILTLEILPILKNVCTLY